MPINGYPNSDNYNEISTRELSKHIKSNVIKILNLTKLDFIIYSRLSLSRLRLSRITAYLEEKIWSLL